MPFIRPTLITLLLLLPSFPAAVSGQAVADTVRSARFEIPAQPLTDALSAFSRQSAIRIEVDGEAAAGLRSIALAGDFTAPAALRRLLEGTGLTASFTGVESATVTRAGEDLPVYALTPITVVGERSQGYLTSRTVSATKTDIPLRDVPQAVTVLPAKLITDLSMQGMSDVVRYVPGITMGQGEGHRDAPTIRGNSSTADFFQDGMRDDVQYFRDLYNVDRVEALKGANAMIFGRGGGGGVLNRVSKEAQWAPSQMLTLEGGSYDHMRGMVDVGQGLNETVAGRLAAMYESSEGFRDAYELRRYGINPTLALAFGPRTVVRAGYERFEDERTVDRGIPSFQGGPSDADLTTFFGNPSVSEAEMRADVLTAAVEHLAPAGLTLRSRIRYGDYGKFYRNSLPGALNAAGTQVALSAYDNRTDRSSLLGQADLILSVGTGSVRHSLLVGAEGSSQDTENFRQTGYYNGSATTLSAPFDQPTVSTPIEFRQSATDADNESTATVAAVYAQDQLVLTRWLQAIVGVRYDRFEVEFLNRRNDQELTRTDELFSPRAGLVVKPAPMASLYGAYSVSYLPSSGDQFSSLTATSATLEPERFKNLELGAKWDVRPNLSATAAVYRLDRTNTTAPDPANPALTVQTGEQRSEGIELGATGNVISAWQISGGLAWQRAEITSRTSAASPGAKVPLVPGRTASMWNRVQVTPRFAVGLGILNQSDMFTAIDNTVTLPGFTRVDGALFVRVHPRLGAQLNVENMFDTEYYPTSHGNNNIMPGAPRTIRVSVTTAP
jgi:catecholate siderophore receptor